MTEPWAYKTMSEHAHDVREYVYSLAELEACQTHDEYWNAAMLEMVTTGFMHNYMRMYWAKKIIEWSPSFKEAFERTVYLDDNGVMVNMTELGQNERSLVSYAI